MHAPSRALALEDEQLVAKRENLGLEPCAQRSNRSQESQKGRARHRKHVDPARRKHQSFVRQESLEEEEDLWKRESETSFRTQRGMPARERLATTR